MGSHNIQRVSRRFRYLFRGMAITAPLLTLAYWLCFNQLPEGFLPLQPYEMAGLSWSSAMLALLASLLPLGVAIFALLTLSSLFLLYEKGVYFSMNNVALFKRLGVALLLWVPASFLYNSLLSIIVTIGNPPGERLLVAAFGYGEFAMLLMGGIVILISWIMNEGRKLEDEQAHTI